LIFQKLALNLITTICRGALFSDKLFTKLSDKIIEGGLSMEKIEKALESFKKGYNCSQSVFSAYSDIFNVDRDTALLIASGLGGGIGRTGNVCGAVTGAVLILGLKYGFFKEDEVDLGKERIYPKVKEFLKRFEEENKSIICKELIGVDIGTEEGLKRAKEEKIFGNICPKFVESACKILEEMLK